MVNDLYYKTVVKSFLLHDFGILSHLIRTIANSEIPKLSATPKPQTIINVPEAVG
jgi:hypothetical protein